jgi:hypothetical protein
MDKSKLLEGLKKIKEAFATVQKFTDAKLNDGVTIVRYDGDMLMIGMPVMAVTEQGALAMPDGDYILQDGTAFTVANGMVAEVSTAAEENADQTEPTQSAPANTTNPAQAMTEANVKSIVESTTKETYFTKDEVKAMFDNLNKEKETFATQKIENEKTISDFKEEVEKQKQTLKLMFELLEKMAGEPSAEPTEKKKAFSVSEFRKAYKEDLKKIENL